MEGEIVHAEDKGDNRPPDFTLRPFHLYDIDDFMVRATDDRASRFLQWDTFVSREAALSYFKNRVLSHPWRRAICLQDRPIGAISVSPESADNSQFRASIGYVLAPGYWGRGIATRAVKMVVSTIFDEFPQLERLEAVADVENPASQRVLEKAGFVREAVLRKYFILKGTPRDVVMYSLLAADPKRLD
ncbi:LOW QUALITY PROTEIN: uncharacterized protein [Aristolochia californica]|uniref:LOW QUALITY PROTEIN: uncharacterized protein n=1 Tax=Aristolochia californica TaxID=171875 RepID=UPI0035E23E1F